MTYWGGPVGVCSGMDLVFWAAQDLGRPLQSKEGKLKQMKGTGTPDYGCQTCS